MLLLNRFWILLSAMLVADGWILSACHALNATGYAISFAVGLLGLIYWQRQAAGQPLGRPRQTWAKLAHRFRRPAPQLFLLMALLNLAGGLIARQDSGDTNSYRIPRVLHWLWQGSWHWIHTDDSRMNIAGAGFEWLFAPLILFLKTDRWIFLVNALPYFLLPGLTFMVLRQLGVARRVAWWWMWILATGWCFVLQACSTINDSLAVTYALAAVGFALCARKSGRPGDLHLSLLAVALLTGFKQTNLPLVLPWFIAAWPARRLLWKQPVVSAAVVAIALIISVLPLACLNWEYSGTWTGFPKASQAYSWGRQQELTSPFWGLLGNCFCFPAQNLLPPLFPCAGAWNAAMHRFLTTGLGSHFNQFEDFCMLGRSVTSSNAGIGLGIIVLTAISMWAARRCRSAATGSDWSLRLLQVAPWISLLVFLVKVGTYQNARQAGPYYILLFPLILAGAGHARLVRQRWWQWLALALLCFTLGYLGFARGRQLVPTSIVAKLEAKNPHSKWVALLGDFYAAKISVASQRNFLNQAGVTNETIIGYATTCSGAEPGWWMPFGVRKVERVLAGDTPAQLREQGIHYVAVEDLALNSTRQTIQQWAEHYRGEVISDLTFTKVPGSPVAHLYLVHLQE